MRMLHLGLAGLLLMGWAVSAEAAGKGKKGKKAVHGTVTAVTSTGNGAGTITVQVRHHKKKNQAASTPPVEKTFNVSNATTFQKVQHVKGQKGQVTATAASFKDVSKGTHVLIHANGGGAEVVKIVHHHRKKK